MNGAMEFRVHGMDCADEVAILRKELGKCVAEERLSFEVLRGKMTITSGTPDLDAGRIVELVAATGMRAVPWSEGEADITRTSVWQRQGRTILTVLCGAATVGAFGIHAATLGFAAALGSEGAGLADRPPTASIVLYVIAIAAGGRFVIPRAWAAARRLRPDMHLLMTIAVLGAVAIGEWFEAATVTLLFSLSLALEAWSVGRARRAVEALMAIAPETARRIGAGGSITEVRVADVAVGDRLLVKPGDRIPLDGGVLKGASHVNQAPITGESLPVTKEPGAEVFAGTINGDGALEIEVKKLAGSSTLAQIIRMVGEAQRQRAPSEQWVDRFALVYTPVILAMAVLTALIPPLFFRADSSAWFYKALVLLVIGCPCALVISTPVSIVASLAAAAKAGALVKGGAFMEAPASLRVVALDKTGTLTRGEPEVVELTSMSALADEELLRLLAALESHSDHPLARAIVAYARERRLALPEVSGVQAVQGRGLRGRIGGRDFWAGSHRYLEELGQETPEVHDQLEAKSAAGRTVVVIGDATRVLGLVTLSDAVRPESRSIIEALKEAGIQRVVMLTGDNRATAERVAAEVGIQDVRAELLPADKVAAIEELVREHKYVAMVGDGVNDAPAMSRATLGIAMGAAGSDAAIEAADVALMSDDLSRVPWLIRHSRRTMRVVRQNVTLSLVVKVVVASLTLTGHAELWAAIAADMGVSLVVIANALRLLRQ